MAISAAHQDLLDAMVGAGVAASGSVVPVFAADVNITKVSDGSTTTLRVSTIDFKSGAGHTPAHAHYAARLVLPSVQASTLIGGRPLGQGVLGISGLRILNHKDRFDSAESYFVGKYDAYIKASDYAWKGGTVQLYVGDPTDDPANWSKLPLATINGMTWSGTEILVDIFASAQDLSLEAQTDTLKGFGSALSFASASLEYGEVGNIGNFASGQAFTIAVRFKTGTTGVAQTLIQKKNTDLDATDAGYGITIDSSNQLYAVAADGTNRALVSVGTASEFDDDTWHFLVMQYDGADTVEVWVDGTSEGSDTAGATLGAITNSEALRFARKSGVGAYFDGELDHILIAPGYTPTADERQAWADGPYPRDIPGAMIWEFDEATGTHADNVLGASGRTGRAAVDLHTISGASDEVDMGVVHEIDATTSLLLGQWARTATGGAAMCLIGKKTNYSTGAGYYLGYHSGTITGRVSDGTDVATATLSATMHSNGLFCLLLELDRANDTLRVGYLRFGDAAPTWGSTADASAVGDLTDATASFKVGRTSDGSNPWGDNVSSARIFSAVKTDQEIMDYFQWVSDPGDLDILDAWEFDEGTGTAIASVSGTADGTSTSSTWITSGCSLFNSPTWIATLEGGPEQAGHPELECFGECYGVPCYPVDPIGVGAGNLVYAFGSGAFTYQALTAVYEGQVAVSPTNTSLANNTFELTGNPKGPITADVKGAKFDGGKYSANLGKILQYIVETKWGDATLDATALAEFVSKMRDPAGVVLGAARETRGQVLSRIFRGRLYWADSLDGAKMLPKFLLDPANETADLTLSESWVESVTRLETAEVVKSVMVGFERKHAVPTPLDIATPADARERGREWKPLQMTSTSITTGHPKAEDFPVQGLIGLPFAREPAAAREMRALYDLFSVERDIIQVKLSRGMFRSWIGDVIQMPTTGRWADLGLSKMLCVGAVYAFSPGTFDVRLTLWG